MLGAVGQDAVHPVGKVVSPKVVEHLGEVVDATGCGVEMGAGGGCAGGGAPEPRGHQEQPPAERIAGEWAAGRARHGLVASSSRTATFTKEAEELLKSGVDVARLIAGAAVMAAEPTWTLLTKQIDSTRPPIMAGVGQAVRLFPRGCVCGIRHSGKGTARRAGGWR